MGENTAVEKESDCINNTDLEYGAVIVAPITFVVGGKPIEVECVKALPSNSAAHANALIVVCAILPDGLFKPGAFVDRIWEYKHSATVVDGIKKTRIAKAISNKQAFI